MKNVLLIFCVFMFSSCATIFSGSKSRVVFDSNVNVNEKTNLTIDGVKHSNVSFPYTTKVKRGFSETVVKAEIQGYKPATVVIDKKFNFVSLLNLLSWELIGFGVDAATGAIMKPEYKNYVFEFDKLEEK
ncbi:hypothetical protein Barb6XT_02782 [Bacteroidales bacterium Barb6XT]|nr:hypothetical protein Barb6XT_02782 [Bacteroidales bacterium Barb6XT]